MNIITKLFVFSFLFLLGSCTFDKEDVPEPNPNPNPNPPPVMDFCDSLDVTYSGTVVPILNANCISCHGAGSGNGDYTTYSGVKAKVDNGSFKNRVITLKDMPQAGPLSQADLDKLQCWLDDSAPNN